MDANNNTLRGIESALIRNRGLSFRMIDGRFPVFSSIRYLGHTVVSLARYYRGHSAIKQDFVPILAV